MTKKMIILSHGHGTRYPSGAPVYPGKSSADGQLLEGEYCSLILDSVMEYFSGDETVVRIPTGVFDVPMKQRAKWADEICKEKKLPGCLIEIHTNAGVRWGWNERAKGTRVFHHPSSHWGKVCAGIYKTNFLNGTQLRPCIIKTSRRLGMLRGPKIPSLIVEMAFHTNKLDVEYLKSTRGFDDCVEVNIKSIREIKRVKLY